METDKSTSSETMVPLHVKGRNKGLVVLISKEQMATLVKKQKEGAVCTLSCVPQTLGSANYTSNTLETISAQPISPPVSNRPINVCTMPLSTTELQNNSTSVPAVHATPATQPVLIQSFQPPLVSPNSTVTSQTAAFNILKNVMDWNPEKPPETQSSTVTSLPVVKNSNSGISSGTQTPSVITLSDVMNWNPEGVPSGSQNPSSNTLAMQNKIVGLTYKVAGAGAPSHHTLLSQSSNVAPKSSAVCFPMTIPVASVPKKFVVCPSAEASTPSIKNSNGPTPNATNQRRFLIARMNNALSNKTPPHISSSVSGGNLTVLKKSLINVYANHSQTSNTKQVVSDSINKIIKKHPLIVPKQSFPRPILTREVIAPVVQPDGTVQYQRKLIPCTKDAIKDHKQSNQFTLSEVSCDPSESGIVKKFVVRPAHGDPICSVSLPENTVVSTTPKNALPVTKSMIPPTINGEQVLTKAVTLRSYPSSTNKPHASSLLQTKPHGDVDLQNPKQHEQSSDNRRFQLNELCTSESSSAAKKPEPAGFSEVENDPLSISDDDPVSISDDDDKPALTIDEDKLALTLSPTPHIIAGVSKTTNDLTSIADDDYEKPALTSYSENGIVKNSKIPPTKSIDVQVPIKSFNLHSFPSNTVKCYASSVLQTNPPGDVDPLSECVPSYNESMVQWHQPCTSEPPDAAGELEVAGFSETKNEPVNIGSDDVHDDGNKPALTVSSPPPIVVGFSDTKDGLMSIANDDYENHHLAITLSSQCPLVPWVSKTRDDSGILIVDGQRGLKTSSPPASVNSEEHAGGSTNKSLHSNADEDSIKNEFTSAVIISDSNTANSSMAQSTLKKKKSEKDMKKNGALEIVEKKKKKKKSKKEVSVEIKKNKKVERIIALSSTILKNSISLPCSPVTTMSTTEGQQVSGKPDVVDFQMNESEHISSSFLPSSPLGDTDPLSRTGSSFQWRPCIDSTPENATDESKVVENSEFMSEVNLSDLDREQCRVSPAFAYQPNPENNEDALEEKYSPRSDIEEICFDSEQYFPRIDNHSINSSTLPKCETISRHPSLQSQSSFSSEFEGRFSSSATLDEKMKDSCSVEDASVSIASPGLKFQQKECPRVILKKMQLNLKKRLKAKAEGLNIPCVAMPLKRMLVGGQDKQPNKIRKKRRNSATQRNQHYGQKGKVLKSNTGIKNRADLSRDNTFKPNVLRDCIVRKAIQDCYVKGVHPTVDSIYNACCDSGLDFPKSTVEPHLNSIGYKWVECQSRKLLVEDHKCTAERMKYLKKLNKYQGKTLVYIFVSGYVKKNENGWQVSTSDVIGPCLDSARVVLHAMINKGPLEGGLEVLKLGLFRLRRSDIISWLRCNVTPNIPEGSVIILGHHPIFDKNEESGERPNIGYSKERIVSWLTSHKVTSVNPNLPKALLLSKVDKVILPKTSVFDKFICQRGFIPLHLPKHHMDLNPVEFLWQDILDKLHKSPDIKSLSDFEDFVTQEFSCLQTVSSVACNLVRKFECCYRDFDLRFDELLENLVAGNSGTGKLNHAAQVTDVFPATDVAPVPVVAPVTDVSPVIDVPPTINVSPATDVAPKNTTLSGKPSRSMCPVCLRLKKLKGYRCSNCKDFWYKLRNDYKFGRYTGAKLPFCDRVSHIKSRPIPCQGCRRYRYELVLYHQVIELKKAPKYVIPIPPVTELGKKHWSKEVSRRLKKANLARRDSEESEGDN